MRLEWDGALHRSKVTSDRHTQKVFTEHTHSREQMNPVNRRRGLFFCFVTLFYKGLSQKTPVSYLTKQAVPLRRRRIKPRLIAMVVAARRAPPAAPQSNPKKTAFLQHYSSGSPPLTELARQGPMSHTPTRTGAAGGTPTALLGGSPLLINPGLFESN